MPADTAFCRYYLGELAFNSGDLAEAARQYDAGIAATQNSAECAYLSRKRGELV